MTAFSRTNWTVTCNGADRTREYDLTGDPSSLRVCSRDARSEMIQGAVDEASLRKYLKDKWGWAVNVPVHDHRGHVHRMDFCPEHKDMHGYRIGSEWRFRSRPAPQDEAAVKAGEERGR